ncbi:MAG: outer membrane protein assembly factor BamD [Geobacteraceae bacterium]|nr:outer membrane protein assembly factor BamD [Geobacteraceae bacterium]
MSYLRYLGLVILISVFVSACAGGKNVEQEPVNEALVRFKQGEEAYEKENYTRAIEHWQAVRDMYHSTEMTTLAERKIADAHYAAGQTIEAIAEYENFLKQHPGHPQTREILVRLGKAHFSEMRSADRDQTATRNALATFEQVQRNYPDAEDEEEIAELIRQCKDRLAEKELYIAGFYMKNERYEPARSRLEHLRQKYPEFSHMPKAEFLLAQAYYFTDAKEESKALLRDLEGKVQDEDLREDVQDFRQDYNL